MESKALFLVDGSSYIYRAFFALPFLSNSTGLPTNAIYGFARMMNKLLKEHNPTHLAVVFDVSRETFRTKRYKEYKAQRPKTPDELSVQIPYIRKLLDLLGIPRLELEGYEADDVIATLAKKASGEGWRVYIVSPDKDLLQVVSDKIFVIDPLQEKLYTPKEVVEKFGVPPEHIPTYLALVGDKSDNIPGVRGIGAKRAVEIIRKLGDLESIYKRLDSLSPSIKKALAEEKEKAFLSLDLAKVRSDLPIPFDPKILSLSEPNYEGLIKLYSKLEFSSLLKDIAEKRDKDVQHSYKIARSLEDLEAYLGDAEEFAVDLETTSLDPVDAEIVGISLSTEEGSGLYIPLGHKDGRNLDKSEVLKFLKGKLENGTILKVGQNLKYDISVLLKEGIEPRKIFDTMIASYLLNPVKRKHGLEDLALELLGYKMMSYKEATSSLLENMDFSHLPPEKAVFYACEDADIALRLKRELEKRLEEEGLIRLFYEVEMPLVPVLAKMELRGVKVDREKLIDLGKFLESQLERLEREIYEVAGEVFNINSPRQLAKILFEKLKLKPVKRTKTGYSTDVDVLETLSLEHPLPAKVLEYRQLSKLKSTYIDGLLKQIHPKTGRVHTSYVQTGTATGRLSSKNPNLQNIPVRGELGKLLREAFVAEDGYLLVSADYSQIELRILAAMAGEPKLKEAFERGDDIHAATASFIFGVLKEQITPEMRRKAKVVNFGIIYGMSPYGLSKELNIPVKEAEEYINRYFSEYPRVVRFIEDTVRKARERGFVETLFGRKRPIPELFSPKKDEKEQGRRIAINTPIQGTAADLIKMAMIKCQRFIDDRGLDAYMILQVHDELVFEVKKEVAESFAEDVKRIMENAAPEIDVPLKVDVKIGKTWGDW